MVLALNNPWKVDIRAAFQTTFVLAFKIVVDS